MSATEMFIGHASAPEGERRGVTIYTTPFCGYCLAAKRLLARKNVAFAEIDVSRDPQSRQEMTARAGGRASVPQIFIGAHHVGGSDDLHALEREGRLDALLSEAARA